MQLVAGDTDSTLQVVCKDSSGAPLDLTGATVYLFWRISHGVTLARAMEIVDAAEGVVEYQFVSEDLVGGDFVGEVEVNLAAGLRITQNIAFTASVCPRVYGPEEDRPPPSPPPTPPPTTSGVSSIQADSGDPMTGAVALVSGTNVFLEEVDNTVIINSISSVSFDGGTY